MTRRRVTWAAVSCIALAALGALVGQLRRPWPDLDWIDDEPPPDRALDPLEQYRRAHAVAMGVRAGIRPASEIARNWPGSAT